LELVIGRPISTEGCTTRDMDALSEKVKNAIEDLYYSRARTPDPRSPASVPHPSVVTH
jgi:hypothetical protein